jgi:hypothetical protein
MGFLSLLSEVLAAVGTGIFMIWCPACIWMVEVWPVFRIRGQISLQSGYQTPPPSPPLVEEGKGRGDQTVVGEIACPVSLESYPGSECIPPAVRHPLMFCPINWTTWRTYKKHTIINFFLFWGVHIYIMYYLTVFFITLSNLCYSVYYLYFQLPVGTVCRKIYWPCIIIVS